MRQGAQHVAKPLFKPLPLGFLVGLFLNLNPITCLSWSVTLVWEGFGLWHGAHPFSICVQQAFRGAHHSQSYFNMCSLWSLALGESTKCLTSEFSHLWGRRHGLWTLSLSHKTLDFGFNFILIALGRLTFWWQMLLCSPSDSGCFSKDLCCRCSFCEFRTWVMLHQDLLSMCCLKLKWRGDGELRLCFALLAQVIFSLVMVMKSTLNGGVWGGGIFFFFWSGEHGPYYIITQIYRFSLVNMLFTVKWDNSIGISSKTFPSNNRILSTTLYRL